VNSSCIFSCSDGFSVSVVAANESAIPIVQTLAKAMTLASGRADYSVSVLAGFKSDSITVEDRKIVCRLSTPQNADDLISKTTKVSLALAQAAQQRGGILVHGGLAGYLSHGVVLAAPGGTGKTTASFRLPSPWRSLSDDAALITRDARGQYAVHPWPTWSRFYDGGPMLIESVEQANRLFDRYLLPDEARDNHRRQFNNICSVLEGIPAYRLNLTLDGSFWTLIEESLKKKNRMQDAGCRVQSNETPGVKGTERVGVVFSGNSMYPTFKEPDYLDIVPYGTKKPRRGDVICFQSPNKGINVVHRVMKIKPQGVITRGDNNPMDDPGLLPFSEVTGRVTALKGKEKSRRVRGGNLGMLDYFYARGYRKTRIMAGLIYRVFLPAQFFTGKLHRLAPKENRFQIVFFGKQPLGQLKILMNGKSVGHYCRGRWHIAYPWRLWVDPDQIRRAAQVHEKAKKEWHEAIQQKRVGDLTLNSQPTAFGD
jgi:signal peptidase